MLDHETREWLEDETSDRLRLIAKYASTVLFKRRFQSKVVLQPRQATLFLMPEGSLSVLADKVAIEYGVTVRALRGPSRLQCHTRPRQHLMALAHAAGHSLPKIGAFLSRDHTTVLYGRDAHNSRLSTGDKLPVGNSISGLPVEKNAGSIAA